MQIRRKNFGHLWTRRVLWYLGNARYENNIKYPSTMLLDNILEADNRMPQENINHRIEVVPD